MAFRPMDDRSLALVKVYRYMSTRFLEEANGPCSPSTRLTQLDTTPAMLSIELWRSRPSQTRAWSGSRARSTISGSGGRAARHNLAAHRGSRDELGDAMETRYIFSTATPAVKVRRTNDGCEHNLPPWGGRVRGRPEAARTRYSVCDCAGRHLPPGQWRTVGSTNTEPPPATDKLIQPLPLSSRISKPARQHAHSRTFSLSTLQRD